MHMSAFKRKTAKTNIILYAENSQPDAHKAMRLKISAFGSIVMGDVGISKTRRNLKFSLKSVRFFLYKGSTQGIKCITLASLWNHVWQ